MNASNVGLLRYFNNKMTEQVPNTWTSLEYANDCGKKLSEFHNLDGSLCEISLISPYRAKTAQFAI